jgi:antitoxin component of RelBE/YafQ-DinJ toxin-antitoxin module
MAPVDVTQFNLKLTGTDVARFRAVAEKYGITVSSMIRFVVKQEFDKLKLKVKR